MSAIRRFVLLIGLLGAGSLALSHPVARAEAPPADAPPAKTAEPGGESARPDRQGDHARHAGGYHHGGRELISHGPVTPG